MIRRYEDDAYIEEGFLSKISDLLLCRWTCRNCCQKCYECSCCQSSEDEVEILGPFPAQTPPWMMSNRSDEKEGDSDNAASEPPPTPQDTSPDRRRSSSDTSRSTYSLTRRISSKTVIYEVTYDKDCTKTLNFKKS
ncbi:Hypothetical predicted protein [Pelobates cultripes]|uniref:Uncharacterized protein n=1 Tax=Pelobates cultripes TaxID=61616 RepID=A0AAD1SUP1_PELCU|nr:Hypothetical predicted protein [Pelobates cultripes]